MVQNPDRKRVTADDYEAFLVALCGLPPGSAREECVRDLTRRLMMMYGEYEIPPAPGLAAFARRIGVTS